MSRLKRDCFLFTIYFSCFSLSLFCICINFHQAVALASTHDKYHSMEKEMTLNASPSIESRLKASLWSLFSADALASPTHWFYGGERQVSREYGGLIKGYVKPNKILYGSIMNKSNVNGGGRGQFLQGKGVTIVGDIINHGKLKYWDSKLQIHYHATLQAGENTLEAQLVRVLMKSIVANKGSFNADHFREAYIKFMTTPGTHNDTYVSTCHRMFFSNLTFKKLQPEKCPDNDGHNVDTIDGLVLPTVAALVGAASGDSALGRSLSAQVVSVTRNSPVLVHAAQVWSDVIYDAINTNDIHAPLDKAASLLSFRKPRSDRMDEITACYLSTSLPSAFDMIKKYSKEADIWSGLLANANCGGENVHRGAIIGPALGALVGTEAIPSVMLDGLYDKDELQKEIDEFVRIILK